jgi:hypothetical protein
MRRSITAALIAAILLMGSAMVGEAALQRSEPRPSAPYRVVGTGQTECYGNYGEIAPPKPGRPFYGQDGQHPGPAPSYRDNGDGTVSDLNTGLIWVKARGQKMSWQDAVAGAAACRVAGRADWRMPTIKQLYSLINFTGAFRFRAADSTPYLDTRFFDFAYGDEANGQRGIDCQDWSATQYTGKTMGGNPTVFGVNFADGRIKGYPKAFPDGRRALLYVRYVRGNPDYGKNDFHDNGDGTITDRSTGLIWSKADSGTGMNWRDALAWVQARNKERFLGHGDWRVPNAKELQSIVDYARAPEATDPGRRGPAIDPVFQISKLADGEYPFFWTSTTHLDGPPDMQGSAAVYVAFGRALGWMRIPPGWGDLQLLDVHGAGAQRSDPKTGNAADFPHGRGPQGDVIRIMNFVRCVRGPEGAG